MNISKPKRKCCKAPNIKNEGAVRVQSGTSWEYHCYSCGKTWNELKTKEGITIRITETNT